jgi:hypothetical protein
MTVQHATTAKISKMEFDLREILTGSYHPIGLPLSCSCSHALSGAK